MILGIDPGIATGWALVDGTIVHSAGVWHDSTAQTVASLVSSTIDTAPRPITLVRIERLTYYRGCHYPFISETAEIAGAAVAAATVCGVEAELVTRPAVLSLMLQIPRVAPGKASPIKTRVRDRVREITGYLAASDHASDAIAVALPRHEPAGVARKRKKAAKKEAIHGGAEDEPGEGIGGETEGRGVGARGGGPSARGGGGGARPSKRGPRAAGGGAPAGGLP